MLLFMSKILPVICLKIVNCLHSDRILKTLRLAAAKFLSNTNQSKHEENRTDLPSTMNQLETSLFDFIKSLLEIQAT